MSCGAGNVLADTLKPSVGVLFSGGLDSAILTGHLLEQGHRVQPIYVRSHLCWENDELGAARRFLHALVSADLAPLVVLQQPVGDLYDEHWSVTGRNVPDDVSPAEAVFLPGRNALLSIKAALWCQLHGIERLALGVLHTSPFRDATPDFFRHLEAAVNCSLDRRLQIVAPLANLEKHHVMQLGAHLPLELTFSCISPRNGLHCGRCNKCAERREAFASLGRKDPTTYDSPGNGSGQVNCE